ncbi:hypothetical protein KEM55_003093 [Ascosphaera atra]|nr:hypothetical protein KEM55_003093 [Ascosphaera atra]
MALLPLRLAALAAILAFACYPLYERARLLPILWRSPEKLKETNEFHGHQILYTSELRNCEDVMIIPAGEGESNPPYPLALISCDPGRDSWNTVMGSFTENKTSIPDGELWTYMGYDMLDTSDEKEKLKKVEFEHFNASGFHPLGIEYHAPSSTLWVVSHHYDGSRIEMFKLRFEGNQAVARHLRSVTVDSIPAPNAIAAINDTTGTTCLLIY